MKLLYSLLIWRPYYRRLSSILSDSLNGKKDNFSLSIELLMYCNLRLFYLAALLWRTQLSLFKSTENSFFELSSYSIFCNFCKKSRSYYSLFYLSFWRSICFSLIWRRWVPRSPSLVSLISPIFTRFPKRLTWSRGFLFLINSLYPISRTP